MILQANEKDNNKPAIRSKKSTVALALAAASADESNIAHHKHRCAHQERQHDFARSPANAATVAIVQTARQIADAIVICVWQTPQTRTLNE